MNKKTYSKKKIKKMIIIFIIILFILIVAYFSNPIIIAQMKIKSINNSTLNKKVKIPEYINFVAELDTSNITSESIIKYYNNFAEKLIPKYYKKCNEMTQDEVSKYFDKNQTLIETELGITEKDTFVTFINSLKKIKGDSFILEKYYILDSTIQNKKNKIISYIGIKYENCEDIYFRTIIEKKYQEKRTSINFDANVDLDEINNGMKILNEREEEIKNTKSPFTRGTPIN